ncbi:serine hydrolase domain-containing protein [Sphingobacterium bovistauri]|uniref:Beta-lactamase family protein n=1 Tax=Sphingobacterium bovistauri TaxID=2781959 RepID=A0ABS7Z998_9SPHI|nr:serine hydrolase domain-containing protein [Sphingobacterium bovistauri]MCA5006766.1 beta-lactamase family protein [Sphingobacterium bovistauri]
MKKIISCCLTVLMSNVLLFGQDLKSDVKKVADKYKAVGVAYVVVKDGEIIEKNAIGYSSIENNTPLDVDKNIFRIASISKSFTSTAIMQLVEKKRLSLDDDFSDLVGFSVRNPKFPNTKITLRMVLSHTSSINDVNGYFDLDVINPAKNSNWQKSYNNYEPGTNYQYCNLNFNMAGSVLERLTNIRFDNYIRQQILNPLALYGGYCIDSLDNKRFASLYSYNKDKEEFVHEASAYNPRSEDVRNHILGVTTPIFSPTGGMKISAVDLAKYMTMHMYYGKSGKIKILGKNYSKMMQKKLSEKEGYGLALLETSQLIAGEHLVGHTGSAYGLYSSMFFSPKKKYGIVVITNGCIPTYKDGNVALTAEIVNLLHDRLIK